MRKVEGYRCDHCQKLYSSEEGALNCENKHIMVARVVATYEENDTFPRCLVVYLADGQKAYYEYEAHAYL